MSMLYNRCPAVCIIRITTFILQSAVAMKTATFLLLLAASTFAVSFYSLNILVNLWIFYYFQDVFKEKVKIGKKTCLCTFSLIADGTKLSPKSKAKCDKKCSGVAKKVSIEGARGVFTFDMMVKRGKVTLLRGEFNTPTTPSGSTRPTPTPAPYTTQTTPPGPPRPTPGTEVCATGFTRVCPMMDDRCPPGTEKICPKGMEVDTRQALNRHDGGSSGCQCIPDFLISLMKRDAVHSRLYLVLVSLKNNNISNNRQGCTFKIPRPQIFSKLWRLRWERGHAPALCLFLLMEPD